MASQLSGTIADVPVARFFHLVNLARKTGTYHLYQNSANARPARTADGKVIPVEYARISFEQGALVHATTTGPESRLLAVLYKAGKLNHKQYTMLLERAATVGDKALALSLINGNYVSQRDIVQSMQQHMLDIVYSVMASSHEEFRFEEGELPSPDSITIWVDVENVIAEHARRTRELHELAHTVPNLDLVLRFPKIEREKQTRLHLSQEEWHVLSLVNGRDSIAHIGRQCHMTETEIRRAVSALLRAGLVEPASDDPRRMKPVVEKSLLSKVRGKSNYE